jgi:TolB-like protein/tetratricopeptide (TPR) repeat protein
LNDPVIIEYTKGSYAPVLRYRSDVDSPAKLVANSPAGPASIAVLPFVNMSSDIENEYFSDGLTEELISAISNVKSLRVVSRTSVFRFKGKSEDIRKIGAELNADMVLEGSVRKSGDRLRITAQLIDVASGYHTWSRTYRVEIKDLFAVQEEIAHAITATLSEGARGLAKRPTANLDAYHDYLKGRFFLNKWSEEGFSKSIEFFEAAIEKDREMAVAWAGLADARFVLACYGKMAPRDLMPKARVAAEKAMELDESLAEAHVSLAAVRAIYDWDWVGSEREFRRAMELDPDCAPAYQWCGVLCLMPQGRLKEAETSIRRALDLDPLSPAINTSLGHAYYVQGRYDDAIAYFEKALETDPRFYLAHWWLGVIYFQRSMLLKAFAQFRQAGALSKRDWSDAARFTYGHALIGKRGKARRILEELTRISDKRYSSPVMIAAIHVTLGETDAAFEWLDKAYIARDAWLVWLGVDRRFDSVRNDTRFTHLLKTIGLPELISR